MGRHQQDVRHMKCLLVCSVLCLASSTLPSYILTSQSQILARGTGELGEFGFIVGDPLLKRVKQSLPEVRGYAVQVLSTQSICNVRLTVSSIQLIWMRPLQRLERQML